jgi:coiled-coil domain-containing protein 130
MSSLAAARADNFYYPKDWRPENGSLNQYHKSHPLGKRAKDIADGILVVRFEMPFNVWCTHCEQHIGRGVRYNAKKKKVDMYFTTIIYEFRMPCTNCKGEMIIRTDPEKRGYKLVSGVRKKNEGEDITAEELGTEKINDPDVGIQIASDPFFRLEHEKEDQSNAIKRAKGIEAIIEIQDTQFKDDMASNAALRATFRKEKKRLRAKIEEADRMGLSIPLLDIEKEDIIEAKGIVFKNTQQAQRLRPIPISRQDQDQEDKKKKKRKLPISTPIRSSSSSSTKVRKTKDSFQHFGDTKASQLNRLKHLRLERKNKHSQMNTSSNSINTSRRNLLVRVQKSS